jgi:inosine-uridine nucleoside N-ribohydrolase
MKRVIIDTDIGICNDDCQAIVIALASRELRIEGISVCAGNLTMRQSLFNVLTLTEYLGRPDIKVYEGESKPKYHTYGEFERGAYGQWGEDIPAVWPFGYRPTMAATGIPARQWISQCARSAPGEISAIALGPLTNFAAALVEDPSIVTNLKHLYFVGGAFAECGGQSGNITADAEFNVWVDPEAAKAILSSGMSLTMIPLHLMRRMRFDSNDAARIAGIDTRIGRLYATVLDQLEKLGHPVELAAGDVLGVAAVLWPDLFTLKPFDVDVDCSTGTYYGRTSLRPADNSCNTLVAVDCDIAQIHQRYFGGIEIPQGRPHA